MRLSSQELLEQVKENHKKLRSCDIHEFDIPKNIPFGLRTIPCKRCGGEVELTKARWYRDGYEAGLRVGQSIAKQ